MTQVAKPIKDILTSDTVRNKFKDLLGKKSAGFISSVMQTVSNNSLLAKADPMTIVNAAATAAILDLPINSNLGYAYIVPYGSSAQFQIGYKGFIQLAQRSGKFKTINVTEVKEGEIIDVNRMTGEFKFDWKTEGRPNLETVGYVAYFELLNGFSKALYMSKEDVVSHGKKYSQMFKRNKGLWVTDFDSMASKTVIKLLLSKYAPLSIEMETAAIADQSVQKEEGDYSYDDNVEVIDIEQDNHAKEIARIKSFIDKAKDIKQLQSIEDDLVENGKDSEDALSMIEAKKEAFMNLETT